MPGKMLDPQLKLVKRMSYCRTGEIQLRQRILHALEDMAIRKESYLLGSFVLPQLNRLQQIIREKIQPGRNRGSFEQLANH